MVERKRLLLRLDRDVHDAVARWAADDLRSVNAQIEYALRRALKAAGRAVGGTSGEHQPAADDPAEDHSAEDDPADDASLDDLADGGSPGGAEPD